MDIWVLISRWEYENDASTHLTAGGALYAAIEQVLDYLDVSNQVDYIALLEKNYGDQETSELGVWAKEDLKSATVEELWCIYGYWTEFTWDSKADWEIIRTQVQP